MGEETRSETERCASPTRARDARERSGDSARMVATLAPQPRLVVTLHDGEDRSVTDIADGLGIPVDTVTSTLVRARVDLRRRVETADGDRDRRLCLIAGPAIDRDAATVDVEGPRCV